MNAPAPQPKPDAKDRLINPRAAYDWSRISNELDEAGLSLSAFRVYFNLLRRSDKHFTCYPGGRRIAEDCGLNRETVIKALHELETRGLLQINRNWGRSSDYEILPLSSWKDKDGNPKYPPEPVGKTDSSENPTSRKNRTDLPEKPTTPVGKSDTNRIQLTESKETTTTPRACASVKVPELAEAPSSSLSSAGGVSEEPSDHLSPDDRLELDAIANDFGSDRRQKAKAVAVAKRRGMEFVREQADIVRSKKDVRNLAGAFEKACDSPEGWKRPKAAAKKPTRHRTSDSKPAGAPSEPLVDFSAELVWWQSASEAQKEEILSDPRLDLYRKSMRKRVTTASLGLNVLRQVLADRAQERAGSSATAFVTAQRSAQEAA